MCPPSPPWLVVYTCTVCTAYFPQMHANILRSSHSSAPAADMVMQRTWLRCSRMIYRRHAALKHKPNQGTVPANPCAQRCDCSWVAPLLVYITVGGEAHYIQRGRGSCTLVGINITVIMLSIDLPRLHSSRESDTCSPKAVGGALDLRQHICWRREQLPGLTDCFDASSSASLHYDESLSRVVQSKPEITSWLRSRRRNLVCTFGKITVQTAAFHTADWFFHRVVCVKLKRCSI